MVDGEARGPSSEEWKNSQDPKDRTNDTASPYEGRPASVMIPLNLMTSDEDQEDLMALFLSCLGGLQEHAQQPESPPTTGPTGEFATYLPTDTRPASSMSRGLTTDSEMDQLLHQMPLAAMDPMQVQQEGQHRQPGLITRTRRSSASKSANTASEHTDIEPGSRRRSTSNTSVHIRIVNENTAATRARTPSKRSQRKPAAPEGVEHTHLRAKYWYPCKVNQKSYHMKCVWFSAHLNETISLREDGKFH